MASSAATRLAQAHLALKNLLPADALKHNLELAMKRSSEPCVAEGLMHEQTSSLSLSCVHALTSRREHHSLWTCVPIPCLDICTGILSQDASASILESRSQWIARTLTWKRLEQCCWKAWLWVTHKIWQLPSENASPCSSTGMLAGTCCFDPLVSDTKQAMQQGLTVRSAATTAWLLSSKAASICTRVR